MYILCVCGGVYLMCVGAYVCVYRHTVVYWYTVCGMYA